MALDKRPYRKAFPHRNKRLRAVSTECERLMFHLQSARASTATGLVEADPAYLAIDMRCTESAVVALLAEAHAANLIILDSNACVAFILGTILEDSPQAENNWKGYLGEIMHFPDCEPRRFALAECGEWVGGKGGEWQRYSYPCNTQRTPSELPSNTLATQEQEKEKLQNQEKDSLSPSAPAPAAPEQTILNLEAGKEEVPKLKNIDKALAVMALWNTARAEGKWHHPKGEIDVRFIGVMTSAYNTIGPDGIAKLLADCAADEWRNGLKRPVTIGKWFAKDHLAEVVQAIANKATAKQINSGPFYPIKEFRNE